MASSTSISMLVGRFRGQRSAVPGGTRRDFFGDRVVMETHAPAGGAEIHQLQRPVASCPSCAATVTQYATNCRGCGHLLIRASA
jgi:hypothetical protein